MAHAISFNLFRLDHIEQAEYYTVNYYSVVNTLFGLGPAYLIRGSLGWVCKLMFRELMSVTIQLTSATWIIFRTFLRITDAKIESIFEFK